VGHLKTKHDLYVTIVMFYEFNPLSWESWGELSVSYYKDGFDRGVFQDSPRVSDVRAVAVHVNKYFMDVSVPRVDRLFYNTMYQVLKQWSQCDHISLERWARDRKVTYSSVELSRSIESTENLDGHYIPRLRLKPGSCKVTETTTRVTVS